MLSRGFGWRQPVGILGHAAIVVGIVPAVLAIGDGAWNTPDTPITTFLSSQLPLDPAAGDYRVLYVGDPRVLPVPGREYAPGIAFAVVDAGAFDFTDRFTVPHTTADDAVEEALRLVADGSTLRAGRLLAPHGIRYVVVPETDGVNSTADDPIPVPEGLVPALQNQLDIGSVPGPPAIEVFVNESWFPVGAQLSGATAEASKLAGADVLVRADLSHAEPAMIGADAWPAATDDVTAGRAAPRDPVRLAAAPHDQRQRGRRRDRASGSRPRSTSTPEVPACSRTNARRRARCGSPCRRCCGSPCSRWVSARRASFVRRRAATVYDETLIDLDRRAPDLGRRRR